MYDKVVYIHRRLREKSIQANFQENGRIATGGLLTEQDYISWTLRRYSSDRKIFLAYKLRIWYAAILKLKKVLRLWHYGELQLNMTAFLSVVQAEKKRELLPVTNPSRTFSGAPGKNGFPGNPVPF